MLDYLRLKQIDVINAVYEMKKISVKIFTLSDSTVNLWQETNISYCCNETNDFVTDCTENSEFNNLRLVNGTLNSNSWKPRKINKLEFVLEFFNRRKHMEVTHIVKKEKLIHCVENNKILLIRKHLSLKINFLLMPIEFDYQRHKNIIKKQYKFI